MHTLLGFSCTKISFHKLHRSTGYIFWSPLGVHPLGASTPSAWLMLPLPHMLSSFMRA
jgi:hypothetical protein